MQQEVSTPAAAPSGFWQHSLWGRIRWIVVRLAMLVAAMFVLLIVMVGGAGWYTSRSEFCNSCHIMEPYYKSWAASPHKNVPCIECHFPPGFVNKMRGKMLGLIQLAKYVTQSQGPRPSAEIPDASCLRSGCHETRLLQGKVNFHGIPFDHTPHLTEHRRGKQLRCTSCHSQIVQGKHMTVTPSTCFLCHFKDGQFNQGPGACTRCHEIPTKEFDLGGGVKFTHALAYKKGVDCENCHRDVIRGNGEVSADRCLSCHNREDDLKRLGDKAFLHQMHVTDHKIDCLQCHARIEHSLQRDKIEHAAGDCTSCHPNQHHEQVAMLTGMGGKLLPEHPSNLMVSTRADCRTCHRVKEVSSTGTVLWRASTDTCAMCHEPSTVGDLDAYHQKLRKSLPEVIEAVKKARQALTTASLPADRAAALAQQLDGLQHDAEFLQAANDIHNMHYAAKLQQTMQQALLEIYKELKLPEPKISVPAPKVKMRDA